MEISSISEITQIIERKGFQEAIYLASPDLYYEMNRWKNGDLKDQKKIETLLSSIYKYFARMSSRCTPFGLFAGCATGTWDETNKIQLNKASLRHTRLDMGLVSSLAEVIGRNSFIRRGVLYFPNNTIYKIGGQIRYIEYKQIDKRRKHFISSVDGSKYVQHILDQAIKGSTIPDLSASLVHFGIKNEEAESFVDEIISNKILISELEPAVIGVEYIDQIIRVLERISGLLPSPEIERILGIIKDIKLRMANIDGAIFNDSAVYKDLFKLIGEIPDLNPIERQLIQVDTFFSAEKSTLDVGMQEKLKEAAAFLAKLSPSYDNLNLIRFKEKFLEAYGDREISLAMVLDSESGIGYPARDVIGVNEFVDDINIPTLNVGKQIPWNERERLLLTKLVESYKSNTYTVEFTENDLRGFSDLNDALAPTLTLKFRVLNAKEGACSIDNFGGGSSAGNLLGRFAFGSEDIYKMLRDISSYESECMSGKVVAEISHIPQGRTGNVLLRPVFRDYEIPYLTNPGLKEEGQISIADLRVSVKQDRIVLRSVKWNKEVVPRLSTAHNFSFDSLPVYRFLCDLQFQGITKPTLVFNWGQLSSNFKFLPRAIYKNVIVSSATWNLQKVDYSQLTDKAISQSEAFNIVTLWRKEWKLPRFVCLKEAENELMVDFENTLSVRMFVEAIRKTNNIQLIEFVFDPENSLIKDCAGRPFVNEVIAILFNKGYGTSITRPPSSNGSNKQLINSNEESRKYILGSEWLYYKIYCGVKTADNVLLTTIGPLVSKLQKEGIIKKWFFIRYADPDPHIRLRFQCAHPSKLSKLIEEIYSSLNPLIQKEILARIVTDTYERELERYGFNTIQLVEEYFDLDSTTILHHLSSQINEADPNSSLDFAIKCVDGVLEGFGFSSSKKLEFVEKSQKSYSLEHGLSKSLKLQLDKKFRLYRARVNTLLNTTAQPLEPDRILELREEGIRRIIKRIESLDKEQALDLRIDELVRSLIHVTINRIFKSKQRTYEMVIYYLLFRHYKSSIAKQKKFGFPKAQNSNVVRVD